MKISTKYLGEVSIEKEDIIHFNSGLLGFEEEQQFVILNIPDNDTFCFLQSIHTSYIAFLLINPWDFFQDYDIEVPDEDLNKIAIASDKDVQMAIYTTVTLEDSLKTSTTNLLAPVVINVKDKKGKQVILNDTNYTTKHRLFSERTGV